jgi:hypothetical protein
LGLSGKELDVTALFLAGLLGKELDEGRIAALEASETFFEFLKAGEMEEAFRAGAQFASGLRSAEQQDAHYGHVLPVQFEMLRQIVPVFLDPGAATKNDGDQFLFPKSANAVLDGFFVVSGDGFAIGSLVASGEQAVEGEGVILRNGPLLFEEAAENA